MIFARGAAVAPCLAALDKPDATVHVDWPDQGPVPTSSLLTIYRRRADHVDAIGLPTLGFREAVQRLEETAHEDLPLAGVEGAKGYPSCTLFLAPDEPTVLLASLYLDHCRSLDQRPLIGSFPDRGVCVRSGMLDRPEQSRVPRGLDPNGI